MPLTLNVPSTPVEPITEMLYGIPVTDPYRWLEEQNSLRTRRWLEEQTAYTRAYLDAIPCRGRVRNRVSELLSCEAVSEPLNVGNRYVFMKRAAHEERPAIMMREGDAGEDVRLVEPAERDEGGTLAVNILNISSDARYLAYSVRYGGEDSCAVEIFDVYRRTTLPDRLPRGLCRGLAFLPEGNGFYYVHGAMGTSLPHLWALTWHA